MTENRKIERVALLTAEITSGKAITQVQAVQIDLAPLQEAGLHLHPIPVVGCITKGAIYFQIDGQAAQTLKTGDAFYEPANTKILHFDNPSEQESAGFVAFYLLGGADKELIKML
jgi:quercetin dioxygenase-like cupin family protein